MILDNLLGTIACSANLSVSRERSRNSRRFIDFAIVKNCGLFFSKICGSDWGEGCIPGDPIWEKPGRACLQSLPRAKSQSMPIRLHDYVHRPPSVLDTGIKIAVFKFSILQREISPQQKENLEKCENYFCR